MRPNGLSHSTLILLLTLSLSILAHATVLLWGNSDADTAKLPGQRLQVQVSVASKPAAKTATEQVDKSTQPGPEVAKSVKALEKQPVQQAEQSKKQVAVLPAKPIPVKQSAEKATVSAPAPEPERPVARVDKPVPPPKPEPVKQEVPPPVEPVSLSADSSPAEAPLHPDAAMESSQTQQASFRAAHVRKQPKPHYPRLARRRGQEGTVWLRVQIDTAGKARSIEIERSSGFEILDKAALKAVRSWRFLPALQDGQARVSYVKIPVKFQLDTAR